MRHAFRVLAGLLLFAALLAPAATPTVAAKGFVDEIQLPNGWQPEGIVFGKGPIIYSGSRADGSIFAANVTTGQSSIVITGLGTGFPAVGLSYDARTDYLFVAGGASGQGRIYNTATGALVQLYQFTVGTTFVNDVIVTRSAAYFTDSRNAVYYRVPLGLQGQPADPLAFQTIPLSGDFVQVTGFNSNGIEATPNGKDLIIVNSTTGQLFLVAPNTGVATLIDLGGQSVSAGDGLLLRGHLLYVVRNQLNVIVVFRMGSNFRSGTLVETITSPNFDIPTTIAAFGSVLYAVNGRFTTPATPTTPYSIVRAPTQVGK